MLSRPTLQQAKADFLAAVQQAWEADTPPSDEPLITAWKTVCQQAARSESVEEFKQAWTESLAALHAICLPWLVDETKAVSPADAKHDPTPPQPVIGFEELPPVKPMVWHFIAASDSLTAEAKLLALQTPVGQPAAGPVAEVIICAVLYWPVGEDLHIRYQQWGHPPLNTTLSALQQLAEPAHRDPITEAILAMPALQDALTDHSLLTPAIWRALLYHIQQKVSWASIATAALPPQVICQNRSDLPIFYARWFTPPASSTSAPLPGQWQVVYPTVDPTPITIDHSLGWVQLDARAHAHLYSALVDTVAQRHYQQRTTQCTRLYQQWQAEITATLPISAQIAWHLTLGQALVQEGSPTAVTQAIIHGGRALALAERSNPTAEREHQATEYKSAELKAPKPADHKAPLTAPKTTDSAEVTALHHQLDQWLQLKLRHPLTPLLPDYQRPLLEALKPLQRHTGRVELHQFQAVHQLSQTLLPYLLWLDPVTAHRLYDIYNQAWLARQHDIAAQVHILVHLTTPTIAQQTALTQWKTLLTERITQWQEDGYLTLTQPWSLLLIQLKAPTLATPFDRILMDLQKGLRTLSPSPDAKTTLSHWEKAQQAMELLLARHAAHGQFPDYQPVQQRYLARLRSYQALCEALITHYADAAPLAQWCRTQADRVQTLTPDSTRLHDTGPSPYPWQTWRAATRKGITTALLQTLVTRLRDWLPTAPCAFELLVLRNVNPPDRIGLHLLVAEPHLAEHPYFTAYTELVQLYCQLLPTSTPLLAITAIGTPTTLAALYHQPTEHVADNAVPPPLLTDYQLLFHQSVHPTGPATQTTALLALVNTLRHQLRQAAANTQARETAIRTEQHALHTQSLLLDEKGVDQTGQQAAAEQQLTQRLAVQQTLRHLWQQQQDQTIPAIDLLAMLVMQMPAVVEQVLTPIVATPPAPAEPRRPAGLAPAPAEQKGVAPAPEEKTTPLPLVLRFYRTLPRFVKARYIQQLEKHGLDKGLLARLCRDADPSGWCYAMQQETQAWHNTLRRLGEEPILSPLPPSSQTTTPPKEKADEKEKPAASQQKPITYPKVTLNFMANGQPIDLTLPTAIVQQLLDEKGQWRSKEKGVGGRHLVFRVVIPATATHPEQVLWFKLRPEQPSTEWIVKQIDQRLGCFASPPHQFGKIQIAGQAAIPVLISQEVAPPTRDAKQSCNLADVLQHRPQQLAQLSPLSLVQTVTSVLVIFPEDDKSGDYFWLPDPDKPGYFRLVRIDRDRGLLPPDQEGSGWLGERELNVKTIAFCFNQMLVPWAELAQQDPRIADYQRHIQQLVPAEVFQDILREASDLHDQWCQLFLMKDVTRIVTEGLAKKEIVLPVMLILPDCEKALLERLYLIQQAWLRGGIQGLSLLESVSPRLAEHYRPLLMTTLTPAARFAAGPGRWYEQDAHQQPRTTLSGVTSLSRQLNLAVILKLEGDPRRQIGLINEIIQRVWCRQQYSAAQALYGVGVWQQKMVLQIEKNLLNPATTEAAVEARRGAQLQFQLLPMPDRIALFKRVTQQWAANRATQDPAAHRRVALTLLETLTQTPLERFTFTPFREIITDELLIPLLIRAGRQLLSLNINGCRLVTPAIIPVLIKHCPNLRHLRGQQLSWRSATLTRLPYLTRLDLAESAHLQELNLTDLPQLHHVNLRPLPQLQQLSVSGLPQLPELDISQLERLQKTSLSHLPRLTQLNASQSTQLQQLSLHELPLLANLNLHGCRALRLVGTIRVEGILSRTQIVQPCPLPRLTQIDISHCVALETMRLIGFNTENLNCVWEGLKPEQLVKWVEVYYRQKQISYQQQDGIDTGLFTPVRQALQDPEGVLKLANVQQNHLYFECLGWLIKLNLPIKRLHFGAEKPYFSRCAVTERDYDISIKLLLVGEDAAGKSTLLDRFSEDAFNEHQSITCHFNVKRKIVNIDGYQVKLQIWDTPGLERFRSTTEGYFRGADVHILCSAPIQYEAFNQARDFYNMVYRCGEPTTPTILLATRMDQLNTFRRDDGDESRRFWLQQLAKDNDSPYMECSAKTGEGVEAVFMAAARIGIQGKRESRATYNHFFSTIISPLRDNHHLLSIELGDKVGLPLDVYSSLDRNRREQAERERAHAARDHKGGAAADQKALTPVPREPATALIPQVDHPAPHRELKLPAADLPPRRSFARVRPPSPHPKKLQATERKQTVMVTSAADDEELTAVDDEELSVVAELGSGGRGGAPKAGSPTARSSHPQSLTGHHDDWHSNARNERIRGSEHGGVLQEADPRRPSSSPSQSQSQSSSPSSSQSQSSLQPLRLFQSPQPLHGEALTQTEPFKALNQTDASPKTTDSGDSEDCQHSHDSPSSQDSIEDSKGGQSPITPETPETPKTPETSEVPDLTTLARLTRLRLDDPAEIKATLAQLPRALSFNLSHSFRRPHGDDDAVDLQLEPEPEPDPVLQLKQLCLQLNYQQRTIAATPHASYFDDDTLTALLSPTQAYIQAHAPLQQYHDVLLQTLESQILAALLGKTGQVSITGTTDTALGITGGVLGAVPVVGGLLAAPVAGLKAANQAAMRRRNEKISQLFRGIRDVEAQVAQLAEQMTLSISAELLENKPTTKRHAAQASGGLKGYYANIKSALQQKKSEWINWQSLTPAQQKARVDAEYLMDQLPSLVSSKMYRGSQAKVAHYLKILMHDPSFCFDKTTVLVALPELAERKSARAEGVACRTQPAHHQGQLAKQAFAKYQTCLATLKRQSEKPITAEHWPFIEATVEALEDSLLALKPWQEKEIQQGALKQMLADWFDRLATPSSFQSVAPTGKSALFQPPTQPPQTASSSTTSSTLSAQFLLEMG